MGSMKKVTRTVTAQLVPVPSADERRAEELTAAIADDLKVVMQSFWRIGRALDEVLQKRLFAVLGYDTFSDYVSGRLGVERAQAYKIVRVATYYFQEDAEALGLERAAALIPYAKLLKTDPGLLVREKALVGDKPIAEATKRDIVSAAASVRAEFKRRGARSLRGREQKHAENAVHDGVRAALVKAGLPRPVNVRFDAKTGELLVRLPSRALFERFAG